jgi:predicted RNase H-like HicB family nuclease
VTAKFKVVVEKHPDGYIAYPLGVDGVIVGQGDTFDEAVSDVTSALRFHVETFGANALVVESPVLEAVVIEAALAG